jgi:hypothetical protein
VSDARRARILCVVGAGRRVADAADPLGREARAELRAVSGLSPEGIELALTEHLETDPAPADLDALLSTVGAAPRCHVVLSANVCTAALRAIALAVATAPAACIRPSRRDPVLAAILVRALSADPHFAAAGGSIARVADVAPAPGDELHVYGTDQTVATLTTSATPGVIVRGHGTGMGLAVIGLAVDLDAAADAVARDTIAFDQRGCLSPRMVLIEGDADRASAFAAALDRRLAAHGARVPRGPLDPDTAAAVTRYRSMLDALGEALAGPDHLVGLDPSPRALVLPPAARVLHVVPATAATAPALLAPWAGFLTTIGSDDDGDLARAVAGCANGARRARLGRMQRPPLDGPVDLRQRVAAAAAAEYRSEKR